MVGFKFIQSILLIVLIVNQSQCKDLLTDVEILNIFDSLDTSSSAKTLLLAASLDSEKKQITKHSLTTNIQLIDSSIQAVKMLEI